MPADFARVRAAVLGHRVQSEAIGVAFLALVAFVVIGVRAHRASEPLRFETARLGMASEEVARFRSAFAAGRPEQELLVARLSDSLGVAVARTGRVALAQRVAAQAEALGLANVRVKFAAADSAAPPQRPELFDGVAVADYTIVLDCEGGLAPVLSLLNQLPASVALERIVAAKTSGTSQFRVTLAVFESSTTSGGGAGQHG
ncbi:MAG: hypothetical protein ACREPM_20425 [Gemmatimonadaceae bacterium]